MFKGLTLGASDIWAVYHIPHEIIKSEGTRSFAADPTGWMQSSSGMPFPPHSPAEGKASHYSGLNDRPPSCHLHGGVK